MTAASTTTRGRAPGRFALFRAAIKAARMATLAAPPFGLEADVAGDMEACVQSAAAMLRAGRISRVTFALFIAAPALVLAAGYDPPGPAAR